MLAFARGHAHRPVDWRLEEGANLLSTLAAKFSVYPDLLEKSGYHAGFTRKGWGPGSETARARTRNPAGPRYKISRRFLEARPKDKPFCFWFGAASQLSYQSSVSIPQ